MIGVKAIMKMTSWKTQGKSNIDDLWIMTKESLETDPSSREVMKETEIY